MSIDWNTLACACDEHARRSRTQTYGRTHSHINCKVSCGTTGKYIKRFNSGCSAASVSSTVFVPMCASASARQRPTATCNSVCVSCFCPSLQHITGQYVVRVRSFVHSVKMEFSAFYGSSLAHACYAFVYASSSSISVFSVPYLPTPNFHTPTENAAECSKLLRPMV